MIFFQIDENENLPKCICDSCIIQLNVAYNLKKAAVQSDIKLRQYVIEYGVNVTSYTTCINTVSIVRPPGILMASDSNNSPSIVTSATSAIVTTEKQTNASESFERPPFAVMPMVIKEEPIDYEVMSDITIESNAETYGENGTNEMARQSNSTTAAAAAAAAASTIIARRKEKHNTQLASSLMVAVNDKSLLASTSTSDVDYINAYMQTPSSASDASESTSPIQVPATKPSASTAAASSADTNHSHVNVSESPQNVRTPSKEKTNTPPKKQNTRQQKHRKAPRELRMLQINLNKISNVLPSDVTRASRTSTGHIAPKTYFEHNHGKSNRNKSMEKSLIGEKSRQLIRLTYQKSSATRQKTVVSPAMKKIKLSLRQRSSLWDEKRVQPQCICCWHK